MSRIKENASIKNNTAILSHGFEILKIIAKKSPFEKGRLRDLLKPCFAENDSI
jgi:hypothetical protein